MLDWVVDLTRRTGHRIMLRLVKGAYWDSEIKRAQIEGQADFPVFTRKVHTDVSYLAWARRLLDAPDAVLPQLATHYARTLAAIHAMAGPAFRPGRYEFQCLHGMGEPLCEEVVGPESLGRPCRIYAPVSTHATLLAYLVRRLLENGANSFFVHRIGDAWVPMDALVADPVAEARAITPLGAPHPRIARPRDLFGAARRNSAGLDLADEATLARLSEMLAGTAAQPLHAAPLLADGTAGGMARAVCNPADHRDAVGQVIEATPEVVGAALAHAEAAAPGWVATPPAARAAMLERAADLLEARMPVLIGPIVREAGRTLANAVGEVREAVDFLRYYAAQARDVDPAMHVPLGALACTSPWNFPLAIFTGQLAAALAAGNAVLAKPAEETPLVAALAVSTLRDAGVPPGVLQLLPGDGRVGAQVVADARIHGVMFTGSTEVARLIARSLAERQNPDGTPVPLIAETGGQNALIVDSSALPEQVVADVLTSAFDSAGQRCSTLRLLCLQEEEADRVLAMLRGAMVELAIGNPDRLSTDVGPVITAEVRDGILAHVAVMWAKGRRIHAMDLPAGCTFGTFVAPMPIEIEDVAELDREIFGPVLHVLRFRREALDALLQSINATGCGLTFGIHSRVDETVLRAMAQAAAGNVYVKRNLIGVVVGVQPFGGRGLSGTGPKAGGLLSLRRLFAACPVAPPLPAVALRAGAAAFLDWQRARHPDMAEPVSRQAAASRAGLDIVLPGPVGEENRYALHQRGRILCRATTREGLLLQVAACLATDNAAQIAAPPDVRAVLQGLPGAAAAQISEADDMGPTAADAVLFEGDPAGLRRMLQDVAGLDGPTHAVLTADGLHVPDMLLAERSTSTNTAAAGGNASLMSL